VKNAFSTTNRPSVPVTRDWGIVDAVTPRMTVDSVNEHQA
jgi:hypothetical protein